MLIYFLFKYGGKYKITIFSCTSNSFKLSHVLHLTEKTKALIDTQILCNFFITKFSQAAYEIQKTSNGKIF